ncbi:MAG TPA: hypothetical protein VIR29_13360 [Anseongella sp.]
MASNKRSLNRRRRKCRKNAAGGKLVVRSGYFIFAENEKEMNSNNLAGRIVDFQMTWSLVVLLVIIVFIVSKILHLALPISPMLFWVTVPAFYILNTLAVLLASLQLVKGRERIFSVILAWSGAGKIYHR